MFTVDDWVFEPRSRMLTRAGNATRLTCKGAAVLAVLCQAQGQIVSRAELLDEVWPDVTVGEEVLTQAIAEIRRALGEQARTARCLKTIHRSGYCLTVSDLPRPTHSPSIDGLASIEAYAVYLDACEHFAEGGRQNVEASARLFSEAGVSASLSALSMAGEARSLGFLRLYYGADEATGQEAARLAREAASMAPDQALTQAALGFTLSSLEQYEAAFDAFDRAIAQDPTAWETNYLLGRACFVAGRHRTGGLVLERAAALRSEDYHTLMVAAKVWAAAGDEVRRRDCLAKALTRIQAQDLGSTPSPRRNCDRLVCQIGLGLGDVSAHLDEAENYLQLGDPYFYYLAGSLACAGRQQAALEALEDIFSHGWSHAAWLRQDPNLGPLRQSRVLQRITSPV